MATHPPTATLSGIKDFRKIMQQTCQGPDRRAVLGEMSPEAGVLQG